MADDHDSVESRLARALEAEEQLPRNGDTPQSNEDANMADADNTVDQDMAGSGMNDAEQILDYRQFSPGFTDDEESGQAFEQDWSNRQAKRQAAKASRNKKSPRRSGGEADADAEPSKQTKKPRRSLFGNAPANIAIDTQANISSAPATPANGIGNRMSSLNLAAEETDDETIARNVSTGFGLACSDIGSVRNSPVPSDDEPLIPPDPVPYYDFRQNIDRNKTITHVDNDQSGNWDPDQEAKDRQKKALRARVAKKEKKEQKGKGKKKKKTGDDLIQKRIVKLAFERFGQLRQETHDEQNWPENWSDLDSDQERELEELRSTLRKNTPDRIKQTALEDPADTLNDLTGHPAARGSGDHVCEVLPPEGYKAPRIRIDEIIYGPDRPYIACTTCRALKKRCSLKKKSDDPPCKRCRKEEIGCTFDDIPKPEKPESSAKPSGSTAKGKGLAPESIPDISGPRNEFFTEEDIATMHRRNTTVRVREPTPELEMEDTNGKRGMLTKITTSFAHPIQFSVGADAQAGCQFCEVPIFGMAGHFEREVHVIRWHDGSGYAELGGGHCQNEGRTTMCGDCSMLRLQILVCDGHIMECLPEANTDHDALGDELVAAEQGEETRYQLSRWCSLCFSPASFGCSTLQADISTHGEDKIAGCHLRLCLACEVALRERFGGNFDAMVMELDAQPKISEADDKLDRDLEGRARADVGFLRQDGLLMSSAYSAE
ncbi:hypothetical protein E8E13_011364 [Curvularia kusanoi]|uniref:Zn(2)-C6 fungal-type domain-containing protein n=1 Tax=Curvularia kusanoi TaxID=90978 RepID=A0A9P4TLZ5_CURKU|nr:hypothetical protein E8E13_011364 [Curvularia kusanoi]